MNNKQVLLIDMDEVLVDFYNHPDEDLRVPEGVYNYKTIYEENFFRGLEPLPGAIRAVNFLHHTGLYDIYICTKPMVDSTISYTEKADWVKKYLPYLIDKIIMTQNKSLIKGDYLIDDTLENGVDFDGGFILFKRDIPSDDMWDLILNTLYYYKGSRNELKATGRQINSKSSEKGRKED